jgi:hypothetical protein
VGDHGTGAAGGTWRVIASSDTLVPALTGAQERYRNVVSSSFPAAAVKALWDDGYVLTSCVASGNRWGLTARKPSTPWKQSWKAGTYEEVKAFYREAWAAKGSILVMGFGGGAFYVITETLDRGGEIQRYANENGLADKFATATEEGRQVLTVHADNDGWLLVACSRPPWRS